MPPIPPLNLNFSANPTATATGRQALDFSGASFSASGPGDWNIDFGMANSPTMSPGATGGGVPWLLIAIVAGAAWLILKK